MRAGPPFSLLTKASYRAFAQITEFCVELIRQFYTLPRQFRIAGPRGEHRYISYTNAGLQPQPQMLLGQPMGLRKPVFDIKISPQRKNVFSTVSQNELAMQLFKLGLFNPQLADQALLCLELMDFEGKDALLQKVAENGRLLRKLQQYGQLALGLAQRVDPALANVIAVELGQKTAAPRSSGTVPKLVQADSITGAVKKEPARITRAREQAANSVQPDGAKKVV